ncbi:hypothetical protein DI487_02150 [Flavobacterium sediminis]|uniref:Histidine kinase/HSP90-like ATPase domain-containing protein n=1 Tax=Flavobacterium sediminis TaxID=2201181 RepID=A0A2U8QRK3_9FLAO|nr:histidine kinase dimerization/phosphoacceptor domain -containing protein [Flavobacterium sediminis]AWM12788.1 hypothetical protein DI487_02150 [Flavobacterium sediminis]
MRSPFFSFLFLLIGFPNSFLWGQVNAVDSLERELKHITDSKSSSETSVDTLQVQILLSLSEELDETKTDDAILYAKRALEKAIKLKFPEKILEASFLLGKIYNNTSDFDLSETYLKKALAIANDQKDYIYIGDCHFYMARANLIRNNFPESIKHLNWALQAYEKINDKVKIARVFNSKAILYGKQSRHDQELEYYNKALHSLDGLESKDAEWLKHIISTNLAYNHLDNKEYKKALSIFLDSYLKLKEEQSNHSAGSARGVGASYLKLNQLEKALEYFNIALEIYKKTGNKSGLGDINREIGYVYFLEKNYKQAEQYTLEGLKYSTQIGELESIKFCHENLARIYNESAKYKLAYENELLYKKYSDSMFNIEINNRVYELQKQYEFEKEKELLAQEQLQKEKASKVRAEKQQMLIYIIVISLIVLSVLTAAIYYNLKENKKQRKIVEAQKEMIQRSLYEKETLLREIHHRVKNNLQIISSLLNMQSKDVKNDDILYLLKEGQNRIQAMSLIHQKLYQSEDIDKVDIENYVKDLTTFLSQMYIGDSKRITVNIYAHKCKFDFETAVPLGLVINELVSNAYKHAFIDQSQGTIKIEIESLGDLDYELKVSNNGIPLPEDFSMENQKSLGLKIVSILSRQLRGSFEIKKEGKFTTFIVMFKNLKLYKKRND